MNYEKNNNYSVSFSPSVRPSLFHTTLEKVKAQVEYETLGELVITSSGERIIYENNQANELCRIITETLLINPDTEINVNGEKKPAFIVQEVFIMLTGAHLEFVIDNFNKKRELVKNISAYLRTSLYNSVFELNSHYKNQVQHDFGF